MSTTDPYLPENPTFKIKLEDGPTQPAIFPEQDINPSEENANFNGSLLNAETLEAPFEGPKLSDSEESSGVSDNLLGDTEPAQVAPTSGTIEGVLDWVGNDSAKAKIALESEEAKAKPRATLVKQLKTLAK